MKYGTKRIRSMKDGRRSCSSFRQWCCWQRSSILPAVSTVRYAFTDYNILRPDKIKFCGLDNFVELFGDRDFKKVLVNTIYFTVVVVPSSAFWPCFLALLISSRRKGVSIFRAALCQPQHHIHGGGCHPLGVLAQSQPQLRPSERVSHKAGFALRFPDRPKTSMNSIIFMSAWQAAGVSDDDFSWQDFRPYRETSMKRRPLTVRELSEVSVCDPSGT